MTAWTRRERIKAEAARRRYFVAQCRRCDSAGWVVGPDGTPIEPARKCAHLAGAKPEPAPY